MVVQPTPPREPTTATTSDSARVAPWEVPLASPPAPRLAQPLQRQQQLFEDDRRRQEFLGTGAERLQDGLAVAAGTDGEDRHRWEFPGEMLRSAAVPCCDRNRAITTTMSGLDCRATSMKNS